MHKIITITAIHLQKPNPNCTHAQTWAQRAVTNSPQARAASIKPNHSENTKRPRHPRSLSHTHTHVSYFHTTVRRLKPASLFHEDRYIRKASWGRRNRATLSLSFPFFEHWFRSWHPLRQFSCTRLLMSVSVTVCLSLSVFKLITVCFEQISIKPLFTDRETERLYEPGLGATWFVDWTDPCCTLLNLNEKKIRTPEQRWETKERAQAVNTEFFCDFRSSTQTFSKVQRWRPIVWGYPTCGSNQSAAGLLVYITFFQFPSSTSRWQGRVRWRDEREKRIWHWAKRACERSSRFVVSQTQIENNTLIMLTIKATQSEHLIILYNYGNITDKCEYKSMSAHKITFPICLQHSLRESYLL